MVSADHRGADRRRPVRRVRPDAARHRADPRGVRGAAAGHVPPADRVPAEQGRRARVEARLRGVAVPPAPRTTSAARARSGDNASVATPDPHKNMVHVPGGTFRMGSEDFYPEERPVHTVSVDDFWIDEHPVTVADYRRFVKATGYLTFAERPLDPADVPGRRPGPARPGLARLPPDQRSRAARRLPASGGASSPAPAGGIRRGPPRRSRAATATRSPRSPTRTPSRTRRGRARRCRRRRSGSSPRAVGSTASAFTWGDEVTPRGKRMANTWQGEFPWRNIARRRLRRHLARGVVPAQRLRAVRHGRQRLGVDVRLLRRPPRRRGRPLVLRAAQPAGRVAGRRAGRLAPRIPRRVTKGGSHLCAPSYCLRYRPAARQGEAVDTGTSHIGFRCVAR